MKKEAKPKNDFKFTKNMKNEKNSYKGNQNIPKNNMRISRSGRGN